VKIKLDKPKKVCYNVYHRMREAILEMTRRRRKVAIGTKEQWSHTQRLECVVAYLACGSPTITSVSTGIPLTTIHRWRRTDWWKKVVEDVRSEDALKTDAKLAKIVAKGLAAVEDRLDHGDHQFDQRSGELIRKPVSARDAHKISMEMIDKREKLQGMEKQEEDQKRTEDRLLKLAEEFVKFGKAKQIEATLKTTYTKELKDAEEVG
jgi:hypothetical protein